MSRLSLNHIVINLLLLLMFIGSADASEMIGTITHLSGPLFAQKDDGKPLVLACGSSVEVGQILIAEQRTYARIKFIDGSIVTLRPNTRFTVKQLEFQQDQPQNDQLLMNLVKGGLRAVTGKIGKRGNQDAYRLTTPTATLGIRGTVYEARVCRKDCGINGPGSYYYVLVGQVMIKNSYGEIIVSAGEYAFAGEDQTPELLKDPPSGDFTLSIDDLSPETNLGESQCTCEMR